MPTHVYSNDAFTRIFEQSPNHVSASASLVDEAGEVRARMIADGVLIPATSRTVTVGKQPIAAAVAADSATFHRAACQIVGTHPIKFAREVADSADSDPRLVAALRVVLALPPATRDQVVQRASRRKAAA